MFLATAAAMAATVSGQIDHAFDEGYIDEVHLEDANGEVLATAAVDNLTFQLELPITAFTEVKLMSGNKHLSELFLEPDDALSLKLHLDDAHRYVQHVEYAGPGAKRHQSLREFDEVYRKNGGLDDRFAQATTGSHQKFLAAEEKVVRAQHRWVARHDDLGDGLERWLTDWIMLSTLDRAVHYLTYHQVMTGEKVVPAGQLLEILEALPPDANTALDHPAYTNLLRSVAHRWHLESEQSESERYHEVCSRIDAALDGEARDLMRYVYLLDTLRHADSDAELDALAAMVAQTGGPARRIEKLQTALHTRRDLGPGRMAPDFTLPDREGNSVSLSSFAGRTVVIDFWGTWCGPCIEALPAMQVLQAELADEPVAFVFVALEVGRRAQWLKFLGEHTLTAGTHLYAEGQFRCNALERWALSGAPSYAVIDPQGRIVSANAPGPESGLADLLRETLGGQQAAESP